LEGHATPASESATEVAKLLDAMKQGRHGLRVSEAIGIRRNEVELDHSRVWVRPA
jgi:integrase